MVAIRPMEKRDPNKNYMRGKTWIPRLTYENIIVELNKSHDKRRVVTSIPFHFWTTPHLKANFFARS